MQNITGRSIECNADSVYCEHLRDLKQNHQRKSRSFENFRWIRDHGKEFPRLGELGRCAFYLVYNHYHQLGKIKLMEVYRCQESYVCPFCAAGRAAKGVKLLEGKIKAVMAEKPSLRLFYLVLTVKNGPDMEERYTHLRKSVKVLLQHRAESLAVIAGKRPRGKVNSSLVAVEGAAYSYEVTYCKAGWATLHNEPSEELKERREYRFADGRHQIEYLPEDEGWHPHVNFLLLAENRVSVDALRQEWKRITGDSHVLKIKEVQAQPETFMEIMKYAMKFASMEPEQVYQCYEFFKLAGQRHRLTGTLGNLYGLKIEDGTDDELIGEDEPYIRMIYRWMKEQGYERADIDVRGLVNC